MSNMEIQRVSGEEVSVKSQVNFEVADTLLFLEEMIARVLISIKDLLKEFTYWIKNNVFSDNMLSTFENFKEDLDNILNVFIKSGISVSDIEDVSDQLTHIIRYNFIGNTLLLSRKYISVKFLPVIRKIILELIQMLKFKQSLWNRRMDPKRSSPSVKINSHILKISEPKCDISKQEYLDDLHSIKVDCISRLRTFKPFEKKALRRISEFNPSKIYNINAGLNNNYKPVDKQFIAAECKSNLLIHLFLRYKNSTKKVRVEIPKSLLDVQQYFVRAFMDDCNFEQFPDIYINDDRYPVLFKLEPQYVGDLKDGNLLTLQLFDFGKCRFDVIRYERISTFEDSQVNRSMRSSQVEDTPISNKNTINELSAQIKLLKVQYLEDKKTTIRVIDKAIKRLVLVQGEPPKERHIKKAQSRLNDISKTLLYKFEEIQNTIECLRKDILQHGVLVSDMDIEYFTTETEKIILKVEYLNKTLSIEKPLWKNHWKKELEQICKEQNNLKLQESLIASLNEDIRSCTETFSLIKLCYNEQVNLPSKKRALSMINMSQTEDVREQVFKDICNITPNQEKRTKTVEFLEKAVGEQRSCQYQNEFEKELSIVVAHHASENRLESITAIDYLRDKKTKNILSEIYRIIK